MFKIIILMENKDFIMNYKNIPNILSVSRIFLSVVFGWYLNNLLSHNQEIIIPLLVFILILATDFLDGVIARKTSNTTDMGAFLDVSADMFFVLVSYLILSLNSLLHPLFILVLIFKFVEFIYTSGKKNTGKLVFDSLGKNVSKFWIGFPGIVCILCYYRIDNLVLIINAVALITTILSLLSTITRIVESRK